MNETTSFSKNFLSDCHKLSFKTKVYVPRYNAMMPKTREPNRDLGDWMTACMTQVLETIKNLPSGYQRDLQETKEPLMKSLGVTANSLEMVATAIGEVTVNKDRLLKAFTSRIFATDEAFKLVSQGIPFRDAYKHVDYNFQNYKKESPEDVIKKRTYKGTTGNLGIQNTKKKIDRELKSTNAREREFKNIINSLLKL